MHRIEHRIQRSWTISGRYFGYWEGDDLWSYQGRHVGRLRGAEIFAPDGRYIGEMLGSGRLAVRARKLGTFGAPYTTFPPRGLDSLLTNLDPSTHRIGLEDFPSPMDFLPANTPKSPGLPASILC